MKKLERSSGILMHISSLPGDYGIGDFGKEAYKFVDFLEKAGQKNWQILPLGATGYGDSPYQCFSSFAGNPYFIDLDELIYYGYLGREDVASIDLGQDPKKVSYELLYKNKIDLLRLAYERAREKIIDNLKGFYIENKDWLRAFALYMTLKEKHKNDSWDKWPEKYRDYHSKEVDIFEGENTENIYFWVFTQYLFTKQWNRLKDYANSKGIHIIGDLPIYISADSSDLWRNPELFKLDQDYRPLKVAGVPPDYFSKTGQLWGNPIYDWETLEKNNYSWWIERIKYGLKQVDILRIDHFRGFESYWEVNYGEETAIRGKWAKGPGMKFFHKIRESLGDISIIVEDLGLNTKEVDDLVRASGFPNMKVLQFGFSPWVESHHRPHRIEKNSVVYTGTHDNPTVIDWLSKIDEVELKYVKKYLKLDEDEGLNWGFIRGAWSSTAYLAIAPIQDFLGLGAEARMNTPGSPTNNWVWRMGKDILDDELAGRIREITETYNR